LMSRAFQGVYTRFFQPVIVVIESENRVVSVGRVISNTTAIETAMVSRTAFGIMPRAVGFVFHDTVVARA
jgi:hypothetical protein